jgi:hypothetical protein
MPECFVAVDGHDWNVVPISPQQRHVTFNIYLGKRIFISTLSTFYSLFDFFAKVTAGSAVNDHVGFSFAGMHSSNLLIAIRLSARWL